MSKNLTGVIERVTFHNADNGFAVLKVHVEKQRDLVTVVGTVPRAVPGEYVEATGDWHDDPQHGKQFKAESLKTAPPNSLVGIEKFLASGLIKGIRKSMARKIVEVFGAKALQVIDESPTFLREIKGMGAKRIQMIRESWQQQKAVRNIMIFLQSHGIGTARAIRIHKTYGDRAVEMVQSNPYRLANDIWGVGFQTADDLAKRLGIDPQSPFRAQAALRFILKEATREGHCALPEEEAVRRTIALTQMDEPVVVNAVHALIHSHEVVRDAPTGEAWLYLAGLHVCESRVAARLRNLLDGPNPLGSVKIDKALDWVERKMQIALAFNQREAIRQACMHKVMVITGGPGVGKTTIIRGIVEIIRGKELKISLAAPTGLAAKRLHESTGRHAQTIHRLLDYDAQGGPQKREDDPLDLDVLIVDEASMIDISLMYHLLQALPAHASLVLVGDVDQLPSVGPGTVLRDIIGSGVVPVVRLTEIFRQAQESGIVRAAHDINQGILPESAPADRLGDFYFIEVDEPATILQRVLALVQERIPARFALDPLYDVQVLAPMHRSELGVRNLNRVLQQVLNPARGDKEFASFETTFRVGDKVIQTVNNYEKRVFNGDIGRLRRIDMDAQIVEVEFDTGLVEYEMSELDELTLAYALTIHKSQGSEYPAVVIPLHTQHYLLLQRNLLYTAVTRGKKLVVIVGSRKALALAVNTQRTATRCTALRQRLQSP
jgi:exodeoxyribonuclease V alpha subunit